MKNENEKSLSQKAFANYSWAVTTKRLFRHARIIALGLGFIVFVVSMTFLVPRLWDDIGGIIACVFISFFAGFIPGGICMITYLTVFDHLYRNINRRERLLASLSEEEKRTILIDYIRNQIKESNGEIRFCEREIAPFERSKNYHKDRIDMLTSELSNL